MEERESNMIKHEVGKLPSRLLTVKVLHARNTIVLLLSAQAANCTNVLVMCMYAHMCHVMSLVQTTQTFDSC